MLARVIFMVAVTALLPYLVLPFQRQPVFSPNSCFWNQICDSRFQMQSKRLSNHIDGDHLFSNTVLFLSTNNDDGVKKPNEGGKKEGGENFMKAPILDEKSKPGLIFLSILTFWHFFLGPALRPIILNMRQNLQ